MIRQPFVVRTFAVTSAALFALLSVTFSSFTANAQMRRSARQGRTSQSAPRETVRGVRAPFDNDIARIISEIDARNIERTIRTLVSFGTRNTLSEQDNPTRGIGAARDWLYNEFSKAAADSGGRMIVEKQTFEQPVTKQFPRILKPTVLTNIVATLRGTQPASVNRTYVVSGHYDSMCTSPTDAVCDAPGADDDASGVAAALEMARVMATRNFDATIIFMAVAGEEQGLVGSTYFAEQAKQKKMDIEAMFTNDIIGNSLGGNGVRDRNTVRVFSEGVPSNETTEEGNVRRGVGGENDSASRQLARFIKETTERYVPNMNALLVYRRDRYLRGGDHIPFLERGYPAIRFCEINENYNHQHQNVRVENNIQYGDLPQFVDFNYTAKVARVNAANLAALALAPAAPKAVGIITLKLTNDTELRWTANTEPDLAGYEIVWRDTASPVWTNSRFIGNTTTFTARGMSKDNYFFGVRAIDRQGHRSPVSFPRPVR